jgi:hypothetical protein
MRRTVLRRRIITRELKRSMSCLYIWNMVSCPKVLAQLSLPTLFIADSGATCHMHGSLEGMFNLKPHVTNIMVGNNETMAFGN